MARLSQLRVALICVLYLYVTSASAAALKNFTITLPYNISNHGDPNLICTPTKWSDVAVFYLGNYLAHAGTVLTFPGESALSSVTTMILALFFPLSGVFRGVSAIYNHAKFGKDNSDLRVAARAGALCMVIRRNDWNPRPGSKNRIAQLGFYTLDTINYLVLRISKSTHIHGLCDIPPGSGYELSIVPADAEFTNANVNGNRKIKLSSNFNTLKALVALGQSIYAATTLYRARGDQITQYGYAAFGLTVAPYVVMSVINLIGALVTPQYPTMYLVGSSIMDEARTHGCYFQSEVGRLEELQPNSIELRSEQDDTYWAMDPVIFKQPTPETAMGLKLRIFLKSITSQPLVEADNQAYSDAIELRSSRQEVSFDISIEQNSIAPEAGTTKNRAEDEKLRLLIPSGPIIISKNKTLPKYTLKIKPQPSYWEDSQIQVTGDGYTLADPLYAFFMCFILAICSSLVSLAVIGGMSKFKKGHSTHAQRAWTMTWWVFGILAGYSASHINNLLTSNRKAIISMIGVVLLNAIPAIGGFVVVGQMLVAYGTCNSIS